MKKKDMNALIEGLRKISEDFSLIADALEGVGSRPDKAPANTAAPPQDEDAPAAGQGSPGDSNQASSDPAPEMEPPAYSFEQVRGILAEKSRSGHREQVKALVGKYGGEQLSDYKERPDILAALVADAEGL